MTAPFDTTKHERLGRGPKASRAIALSFHDHQKGGAGSASRRLSRARGHGVVRMDHVGKTVPGSSRSVELYLPVNWRRFCRRPFPHSRSDARTSRCCVRKRVCSIPLGQTRAYSMNVLACQPSRSKALQHEPLVSRTSPAGLIHHLRLSSVARLVGIDPNENGLTYGKQEFAPGAKAND